MNVAYLILAILCSLFLGIFLGRTRTEQKRFWAIVDMVWVGCWIFAVIIAANDYTKIEKKVTHDFVMGRLSDIQDGIRVNAYGLKEMYCNDLGTNKPAISKKQYCAIIENILISSSRTRMNIKDSNRSKLELENLVLNVVLPQHEFSSNYLMTFDLQQYSKYYIMHKDTIETSVFDQQIEPYVKLTILSILIIPFGLRFGKSYADYYRITKISQGDNLPQTVPSECEQHNTMTEDSASGHHETNAVENTMERPVEQTEGTGLHMDCESACNSDPAQAPNPDPLKA